MPLRIETGRFVQELLEERICKLCNLNAIEDENHFVLHCPCYNNIRYKYLDKISDQNFNDLDDIMKQKILYEKHPFIMGNMVSQFFAKRKSLLYN